MTTTLLTAKPKLTAEACAQAGSEAELVRNYTKKQGLMPDTSIQWYRGSTPFEVALQTANAGASWVYYNKGANYWVCICPAQFATGYYTSPDLGEWTQKDIGINIQTTLNTPASPVVVFSDNGSKIVICNRSTTSSLNYIYSNDSGSTWATSATTSSAQLATDRPLIFAGEHLVAVGTGNSIYYATPGGTWTASNRGGFANGARLDRWDTSDGLPWWSNHTGVAGTASSVNEGVSPSVGTNYTLLGGISMAGVQLIGYAKHSDLVVAAFPGQSGMQLWRRTNLSTPVASPGHPAGGGSNMTVASIGPGVILTAENNNAVPSTSINMAIVPEGMGGAGATSWRTFSLPTALTVLYLNDVGGELIVTADDAGSLSLFGHAIRCRMEKTVTITE